MGIWGTLFKNSKSSKWEEVEVAALCAALEEYQIRELAFRVCVSMIANAISKCEFRVFDGGIEVKDRIYHIWNIEPNPNENSSVFIQRLVTSLCENNEALIVRAEYGKRKIMLLADSWSTQIATGNNFAENKYTSITCGNVEFRDIPERDVLHFTLDPRAVRPIVNGFYDCYNRIIAAAMKSYRWRNGQHWKVHIGQIAQGDDKFKETMQYIMDKQFKPFIESDGALLPEYDGYLFENAGQESGRSAVSTETRDIRALVDDIFDMTARALRIPPVLVTGTVADSKDAMNRWLTIGIDPLCDNLQEEINRKQYSFWQWRAGSRIQIDTSKINHFDIFQNATSIEKLVGSGWSYNDIQRAAGGAEIDEEWANAHLFTKNFALAEEILTPSEGGENE